MLLAQKHRMNYFAMNELAWRPCEVNKLFSIDVKDHRDKFIVRQPVTFQNKTYFNVHRLLRAIDKKHYFVKITGDLPGTTR